MAPKIGIVTESFHRSSDNFYILGALDEWIDHVGAKPSAFAVRARGYSPNALLINGLIARDIQPVVFLTSAPEGYGDPEPLRHRLEFLASEWKALEHHIIVRWDQEPNGYWHAPWARAEPATYKATFGVVRDIMPGNVSLAYSPILRGRDDIHGFGEWYPGDDCQIVGFDAYARGGLVLPSQRWEPAIGYWQQNAPGKPIWVMETGVTHYQTLPQERRRWLRDLGRVRGVDTAMYFDLNPPGEGIEHQWKLRHRERKILGRMM